CRAFAFRSLLFVHAHSGAVFFRLRWVTTSRVPSSDAAMSAQKSGNSTRASANAVLALTPNTHKYAARQSGHLGKSTPARPSKPAVHEAKSEREAHAPRSFLSISSSQAIFVPALDPTHHLALVSALGHEIEVLMCDVHHVEPTRVTRVGVKDAVAF